MTTAARTAQPDNHGHGSDDHGPEARSIILSSPRLFGALLAVEIAATAYFSWPARESLAAGAVPSTQPAPAVQFSRQPEMVREAVSFVPDKPKLTYTLTMPRDANGRPQAWKHSKPFYGGEWHKVEFDRASRTPWFTFTDQARKAGIKFSVEFRYQGWDHTVTLGPGKDEVFQAPGGGGKYTVFIKPMVPRGTVVYADLIME